MKEIFIIIVLLTIIFGLAIYVQNFLNKTSDNLVAKLEDLKTCIETSKNYGELSKKTDEIYKEWEDINEKWSVIVLHNEIDLIETSLIKMKSKIKEGYIKESIEDLDTTIFLLKHIKEKEKTNLKNIF